MKNKATATDGTRVTGSEPKKREYYLRDNTANNGKTYLYESNGKLKNSECSDGCIFFSSIEEGKKYISDNNIGDWAYISDDYTYEEDLQFS